MSTDGALLNLEEYLVDLQKNDLKSAWNLGSPQAQKEYGNFDNYVKDGAAVKEVLQAMRDYQQFSEANGSTITGYSGIPEDRDVHIIITMDKVNGKWVLPSFKFPPQ